MSRGALFKEIERLSEKHEALSSETRLLILTLLSALNEATWSQLKTSMEKALGRRVNPNVLAFHLRKLLEAGLAKRVERDGEVVYRFRGSDELRRELSEARSLAEEFVRE